MGFYGYNRETIAMEIIGFEELVGLVRKQQKKVNQRGRGVPQTWEGIRGPPQPQQIAECEVLLTTQNHFIDRPLWA